MLFLFSFCMFVLLCFIFTEQCTGVLFVLYSVEDQTQGLAHVRQGL